MRLPSRLPYSPLPRDCDGVDKVSDDPGRIEVAGGRLAGRRASGRGFGAVALGRDEADLGFAVACGSSDSAPCMDLLSGPAADPARSMSAEPAEPAWPADLDARDDGREVGRVDADLGLAAGRRPAAGRAVVAAVRRAGAVTSGFAADIVLAAAVSALAAVVMALVAVFIACMADDIVLADAVALVAAAVILLAADVTLVAADETVLAATAGVADVRPAAPRRAVTRPAVVRAAAPRPAAVRPAVPLPAAVAPGPVARDAVDRGAELRVAREVVLRADVAAEPVADVAAALRVALGEALDDLEPDVGCGRLAVPLDALRLTDLLRAVLAVLRRVAARVVD